MPVGVPTEIASRGLVNRSGNLGEIRRHVVLKSVLANEVQQLLHLRNFDHAGATEGVERIISEPALANIAAHFASSVVG